MQWSYKANATAGKLDDSNNKNSITFPIAFANIFSCNPVFCIQEGHNNRDVIVNLQSLSSTSVVVRCFDPGNASTDGQLYLVAIGK